MNPVPAGFGIVLDRSVRVYDAGRVLVGGSPARVLRLTNAGRDAVEGLRAGTENSAAARALARRLVDAGLAAPKPPRATGVPDVTVVVPVRDRPDSLDRCLAALDAAVSIVVDDGSHDAPAVAAVARRYGATLVRRERAGGPALARNSALPLVATELVAFLDSDCIPEPGWLSRLAEHFADPLLGAVAPRVRPEAEPGGPSVRSRFVASRSPIDLGGREALVVPGGRVAYVPSAALVVRRQALDQAFDPGLRYGEDVDLVWRLHDKGWRIVYAPSITVRHTEPRSWLRVLRRRFAYGTAAAPLSRRHPGRLSHVVVGPLPALAATLALARRPLPVLALTLAEGLVLAHRTRGLGVPPGRALLVSAGGTASTVIGLGRAATMLAAPALLGALRSRRARGAALTLLVAPPLEEWVRRRPRLDPVRWTLACIADDAAYGLGVWRGCAAHRTLAPLRPAIRPGGRGGVPRGRRSSVQTGAHGSVVAREEEL